jgi:hypothetical protein
MDPQAQQRERLMACDGRLATTINPAVDLRLRMFALIQRKPLSRA